MPRTALAETQQRAETLREGVKALVAGSSIALFPPVSISVGVAAYPEHGESSEELLAAADSALYRAKAAGRDRVVVAHLGDLQGIEIVKA